MFDCYEYCTLSDLCVELITRPEESYRMWYIVVCDPETSGMRRLWPMLGRSTKAAGEHRYYMGITLWVGEVKLKSQILL